MQNEVRNLEFLIFFSKSAPGKIFYMMVLGLYTHDQCRNAKNRKVMSFLSQNLCETAVLGPLSFSQSTSSLDYYAVYTKQASRASRTVDQ